MTGEACQDTTAATARVTATATRTEITSTATARAPTVGWDTPQRRDASAASISAHPDAQAVEARARLEPTRAQPATASAGRRRSDPSRRPPSPTRTVEAARDR